MAHRSPAWYRLRGLVILGLFAIAFLFGHDMTSAVGLPADPTFVVAGCLLGPHGVEVLGAIAALLSISNCGIRSWASAYLGADTIWAPDALGDRLVVDGP
jgi:hypothetical protein